MSGDSPTPNHSISSLSPKEIKAIRLLVQSLFNNITGENSTEYRTLFQQYVSKLASKRLAQNTESELQVLPSEQTELQPEVQPEHPEILRAREEPQPRVAKKPRPERSRRKSTRYDESYLTPAELQAELQTVIPNQQFPVAVKREKRTRKTPTKRKKEEIDEDDLNFVVSDDAPLEPDLSEPMFDTREEVDYEPLKKRRRKSKAKAPLQPLAAQPEPAATTEIATPQSEQISTETQPMQEDTPTQTPVQVPAPSPKKTPKKTPSQPGNDIPSISPLAVPTPPLQIQNLLPVANAISIPTSMFAIQPPSSSSSSASSNSVPSLLPPQNVPKSTFFHRPTPSSFSPIPSSSSTLSTTPSPSPSPVTRQD